MYYRKMNALSQPGVLKGGGKDRVEWVINTISNYVKKKEMTLLDAILDRRRCKSVCDGKRKVREWGDSDDKGPSLKKGKVNVVKE